MKKALISLLAAVAFAGCSKGEHAADPSVPDLSAPIALSAGVETAVQSKAISGSIDGPAFPAGTSDVFHLTAYCGNAAPANWGTAYFSDIQVDVAGNGSLSMATSQYYPANGNKVYFYAYTSNYASIDPGNASTPPMVNYEIGGQNDILHAKEVSGISKVVSGAQIQPSLVFRHLLKKVKFKLVAHASFTSTTTRVTKIEVIGVHTKAKLNLATGDLVFDTTTGDLSLPIASGTNDLITKAGTTMDNCLMFKSGTEFTIRVTDNTGYTYADAKVTLTGNAAGEAGTSHLVTLTFKQTEIVPSAEITPWVQGDDVGADIK